MMNRFFIDTDVLVSGIVFDGNELEVIIKSLESGDEIIYLSTSWKKPLEFL